jgi:hypothetical protein
MQGLVPDIVVEQPDPEFGDPLPNADATIERATERLSSRPAA